MRLPFSPRDTLGAGSQDDDLGPGRGHTDLHTAVTILGQFTGQELVKFSAEHAICDETAWKNDILAMVKFIECHHVRLSKVNSVFVKVSKLSSMYLVCRHKTTWLSDSTGSLASRTGLALLLAICLDSK